MTKKIAIIGAGVGGMTAAHDLTKFGCEIHIFEKSDHPGGLAAGFHNPGWEWSLEKYYHHWFASDSQILSLIDELGFEDKVIFKRPTTVAFHQGQFYPLDSAIAALKYPGFSPFDKVRFGMVTAWLRYLADWKPLEKHTAHQWMRKYYGDSVFQQLFEPLLIGKFSDYYKEVNMAWFWARFKVRTRKLGTYRGGFQAFLKDYEKSLENRGVNFHFNTTIANIQPLENDRLSLEVDGNVLEFDQILAAVPPKVLNFLAPGLDDSYKQQVDMLKGIGAVMVIFSLNQPLSPDGYYWYNLPKSAGFPFLALVEHTNFVSAEHFNGETLIYCGDYLESTHEYFKMTQEELVRRFLPGLKRINTNFSADWINQTWMFRTPFAQPIPPINHSRNIPDIQTPIKNLYLASMSQVYPWDRGTNFAVALAHDAVNRMKSNWDSV
jgi:protoporphyrinogen oxidase